MAKYSQEQSNALHSIVPPQPFPLLGLGGTHLPARESPVPAKLAYTRALSYSAQLPVGGGGVLRLIFP